MGRETSCRGLDTLGAAVGGLGPGDVVLWQADCPDTYLGMARLFFGGASELVHVRFGGPSGADGPAPGSPFFEADPYPGFDAFSARVIEEIENNGPGKTYVFDCLTPLVEHWHSDEPVANFFGAVSRRLGEVGSGGCFGVVRGSHSHGAMSRMRDFAPVLIDAFHVEGRLYIHPLKASGREREGNFWIHLCQEGELIPLFRSGEAAAVSLGGLVPPLAHSHRPESPWQKTYRLLSEALDTPGADTAELEEAMRRMTLGNHPAFDRLARKHLRARDLIDLRRRTLGSGRIGGKAAGMLLARRILLEEGSEVDFSSVMESHDSFFIGSDVFFSFLVDNDLFRLRLKQARDEDASCEDFKEVERKFLAGKFPPNIMEQFQDLLDYFGQAPIIVRSSSLLEDSFGNSFAGMYRSEFCVNQGGPDERRARFLTAIKLVYASAINPDALAYRRRHGLAESEEEMAILVQRVTGARAGDLYFPPLAGVAFSHNLYRWTDRIDPAKGMIRLVLGLGTRAVDRAEGDYPRMIAVSHPSLRPESGPRAAAYSQRYVDVLDIEENRFKTVSFGELTPCLDPSSLHLFVSTLEDGYIKDPAGAFVAEPDNPVLTFNNLIGRTDFVKILGEMVARLEKAYQFPVDTEFSAFIGEDGNVKLNLLQCRPLRLPGSEADFRIPSDLTPDRILFRAGRTIFGGVVKEISRIVWVEPSAYREAPAEVKKSLGRVIGRLNNRAFVTGGNVVMIGPGRWGTSNLELGINTTYGDINRASVLVEVSEGAIGKGPEVSYGTHFFQDLVEEGIIYLPVYPEDPLSEFNREFFRTARNVLAELVPEDGEFERWVKVIDVVAETGGKSASVVADPRSNRALFFIEE